MEPDLKDRNALYRLIIGQLHHDGHNKLALDLSNSVGLNPSPPPSDKLSQLVSAARLVEDDADEEEKGTDIQMLPNQVVASIDNSSIDDKTRDYFPFLALPPHLLDIVFSPLSIKDRFALAGVNNSLNTIETESKYHVEELFIVESSVGGPSPWMLEEHPNAQFMIFLDSKSYSSDCIRRIAHNASIGYLHIELSGSSEFHREVYNLIKKIDIGNLELFFEDKDLEKEMMMGSFLLDLTRTCKELWINIDNVTPTTIHKVYKIMFDGSAKIRRFDSVIEFEKCAAFLRLIGIAHRDRTFFSNRNIEVYMKDDEYNEEWHFFDGYLEMILDGDIFNGHEGGYFYIIHHETPESLEKAKNKEGLERVEIGPE